MGPKQLLTEVEPGVAQRFRTLAIYDGAIHEPENHERRCRTFNNGDPSVEYRIVDLLRKFHANREAGEAFHGDMSFGHTNQAGSMNFLPCFETEKP